MVLIAVWSLAAVIGFTLRFGGNVGTVAGWWMTNLGQWNQAFALNNNWLLNVVLFVPATMLWGLVLRRPLAVTMSLIAMSAIIETIQQFTSIGIPDSADFVANSIGALLGGVGAAIGVSATRPPNKPKLT